MTIAKEFLERLQNIHKHEPLVAAFLKNNLRDHDGLTFETILKEYAEYLSELSDSEKEKLSGIFWEQVKFFGTPIIENDLQDDNKCNVYFLFPKGDLENSNELYLQGAFHGFGGINERNKLSELSNTGIMYHIDPIPLNAILNYQYQQKGASNPEDNNSTHRNMYHHRYSGGIILRVNPDREQSHLGKKLEKTEEENYWDRMLSSENTNTNKNFKYQTTLYSDSNNKLQTCNTPLPKKIDIYDPVPSNLDKIEGEDLTGSPYADFTRAVHIFKPSSDEIEIKNVIVFNDGRPYILAGMMDEAEKMVTSGKLPPDTALVFIDALQGLAKTMPSIKNDEEFMKIFIMGGMGVRLIDFDKGIDNYITFLKNLFPQLEKDLGIPNDSRSRTMVGSSLSGTATIGIALKEPKLFKNFIAQSPSPANDEILADLKTSQEASIQLSYGLFEQPRYTDAETDFVEYADKLGKRFNLQPKECIHGHNHTACVVDLVRSLPATLKSDALNAQEPKKSSKSSSITSQSIFSHHEESPIKPDKKGETIQVFRKRGG